MADYSKFLYNQHVLEYIKMGNVEVHLVFDIPTVNKFNPNSLNRSGTITTSSHDPLTLILIFLKGG